MRKAMFWEYLLSSPWLLALIGIGLLAAGGFWLWQQIEESKESDRIRK